MPRTLPDTRQETDILAGTAYIHYSSALLKQGISPELQAEIGLAENFADVLKPMSTSYIGSRTSLYAGSRHGYLLCLDLVRPDEAKTSIFPSETVKAEFLANYDPRERTWYKQGKAAGKPVFSSVFKGAEGNLDLTCAAPYYDAQGFAGVVGISYTVDDIYQVLVENAMAHKGDCFVLDSNGRVIFSSQKEGMLTVDDLGQDIRLVDDSGMADAAKCMTDGATDVMSVEIGGKDYYLAFAPLKTTGWSLGLLVDADEIMAPVKQVEGWIPLRKACRRSCSPYCGRVSCCCCRSSCCLCMRAICWPDGLLVLYVDWRKVQGRLRRAILVKKWQSPQGMSWSIWPILSIS